MIIPMLLARHEHDGGGTRMAPRFQPEGTPMQNRIPSKAAQLRRPHPTHDPWHAVSVVGGAMACEGAVNLRAKRFFPVDAPRLPIAECTWPARCGCTYRHHSDRRATPRRASDRGMAARGVVPDRRSVPGRRADDLAYR
jgi:hypothetical protein